MITRMHNILKSNLIRVSYKLHLNALKNNNNLFKKLIMISNKRINFLECFFFVF